MSSNYMTFLTYFNLINTMNMNCNLLQNNPNYLQFLLEPSLIGTASIQASNQAVQTSNNIIVLSSDDDNYNNSTPKTCSKSLKSRVPTMKRTLSQMTDKTIQRTSTKSVPNSNFSLEDHAEPESAETDFNSPVASSKKHLASKLKQQQRLSASSSRKISQTTQINSSKQCQEENNLRKKSFFEELEEIAFSYMPETNKKIKLEDSSQSQQQQQSLQQNSSSSNLINLYPSLVQQQQQPIQSQSQSQSQQQYLSNKSKKLDLIKEEDEELQISNKQTLKTTKQPRKRAATAATKSRAGVQKKETKINQKTNQRVKKIASSINDNAININYQNHIPINTNQIINCANPQINFPFQPKPILLNQNSTQIPFKFQEVPIKKARAVFAEEVYLKSISQEGSIKLQKFPCFRESDLQIPNEFSQLIQQQFSDDDKCSGDELLQKAVNYMHKRLVSSTLEQNPSAVIPDGEKVFTIQDIKFDRDSEEEEEEQEEDNKQQQQQQSYSNNNHSQYSPYRRQSNNYQNKNNFLSDNEDEEEDGYESN